MQLVIQLQHNQTVGEIHIGLDGMDSGYVRDVTADMCPVQCVIRNGVKYILVDTVKGEYYLVRNESH